MMYAVIDKGRVASVFEADKPLPAPRYIAITGEPPHVGDYYRDGQFSRRPDADTMADALQGIADTLRSLGF